MVRLVPVLVLAFLADMRATPVEAQQPSDESVAAELVGRRAGLLPWEGRRDVLGLGPAALRRRFHLPNDPVETESRIALDTSNALRASVWIEPLTDMRPGDVRAYHVDAELDDGTHGALRARLIELYGQARVHRRSGASGLAFADVPRARRIVLWNTGARGSTVITVERFLSLASLVGQGRPTIGLEGRNWLPRRSASFERTCARAGWWWNSSDDECVLPPTEFSHRGRLVVGDGRVRLELRAISPRSDFEALEAELAQVLAVGFGDATAAAPLPAPGPDSQRRFTFASGAQLWARVRGEPDGTVNVQWEFEYERTSTQ